MGNQVTHLEDKVNTSNLILLNSYPVASVKVMKKAVVYIEYLGRLRDIYEDVINLIQTRNIASYISHESTAKLINVSRNMYGTYQARPGDVGLIFSLAKAIRNPGDIKVTVDDIDVYLFRIMQRCP